MPQVVFVYGNKVGSTHINVVDKRNKTNGTELISRYLKSLLYTWGFVFFCNLSNILK